LVDYTNGSKNLTFYANAYAVPDLSGWYWLWVDQLKTWSAWQAVPEDAGSTLALK
jgi:hypothetical protein